MTEIELDKEISCVRALLERILRVMDEGLFVDYQMEKYGRIGYKVLEEIGDIKEWCKKILYYRPKVWKLIDEYKLEDQKEDPYYQRDMEILDHLKRWLEREEKKENEYKKKAISIGG